MKKRDDKPVQFFHRVSKSTLCYGMAVPLESQDSWMGDIPRGAHIPIKLRVNDIEIEADLTRLNNERSHLQIRYGKKSDEPRRFETIPRVKVIENPLKERKQSLLQPPAS